uniref:Uncharacterized protein n=1 Tax=Lepeophtheirus salmonis TaxID=72036 RepID=A0A0K2TXC0_LEPSM
MMNKSYSSDSSDDNNECNKSDIIDNTGACSNEINIQQNNAPVHVVPSGNVILNLSMYINGDMATKNEEEYNRVVKTTLRNIVSSFKMEPQIQKDGPQCSHSSDFISSASLNLGSSPCIQRSPFFSMNDPSNINSSNVTNQTLIQVRVPNLKNANSNRPMLRVFSKKIYHTIFRVIVTILAFALVIGLMYYMIMCSDIENGGSRPL